MRMEGWKDCSVGKDACPKPKNPRPGPARRRERETTDSPKLNSDLHMQVIT